MNAVDYLLATRRAIARAGLGYSAYAVCMAIASDRARTIPAIAGLLGMTQKGVKDIVQRRQNHLFEAVADTRPAVYCLSAEAVETLRQVKRHLPADRPARRRVRRQPERNPKAQLLLRL